MKSIAPAAMAAIEAGEAIVTGALEILPRAVTTIEYTVVDTVDIHAVTNAATTDSGGLTAGITVSGFDPLDRVRVTLPSGQTYSAWSYDNGDPGTWLTGFRVIPGGVVANAFDVDGSGIPYPGAGTAELARAAFGTDYFEGSSSYTFFIKDSPTGDNEGGLSILVERGTPGSSPSPGDPIRVWGGHGPISIEGNTYQGIGDRGLAQQTAGAIGGFAQGLTLTLSGIEPHALELLDADEVKGASVVVRRLIFAGDGKTLLDAHIFDRGRVDAVETSETIGAGASIQLSVETAARGLGSSGARMRSDSDQRLINPNDGYFKNTAFAGEKMLYWGGRKPHRTGSSGGSSFVSAFIGLRS